MCSGKGKKGLGIAGYLIGISGGEAVVCGQRQVAQGGDEVAR